LADQQRSERRVAVHLGVAQQPQLLELVGGHQVRLVKDQHDRATPLVFLGGEQVHGLRDERGLVEPGDAAQGGDDAGVQASAADGRVAQVDHGVPAGVQPGQGGAQGHGLAGADLAGDHTEGAFADAPADPGDRFGVRGVPVQGLRGQRLAERGAGETVVGLQLLDHCWACRWVASMPVSGSWA
jgi:hypothetical protein